MNIYEMFSHIHQGSCITTHTVMREWSCAQLALHCSAQAVVEHRQSDQVNKVHFCFSTFYHPTASEEMIATDGLLVLNLKDIDSITSDLQRQIFIDEQLHELQLQAQEAILNDAISRTLTTSEEMWLYEEWIMKSYAKRTPLSAMPNRTHLKTLDHSQKVGVVLRSYIDEFLTAYTANR